MKGRHKYVNYFAAYNYCAPSDPQPLTSVSDYMKHTGKIMKETDFVHYEKSFKEWRNELGKSELYPFSYINLKNIICFKKCF